MAEENNALLADVKALRGALVCMVGSVRQAISDGLPTTNDILYADKIANDAIEQTKRWDETGEAHKK